MKTVHFKVEGIPRPGGSKSAFTLPNGRIVVTDAGGKKTKDWRKLVALAARNAYHDKPLTGPLIVDVTFTMPRPKSHYGTGKRADCLKIESPNFHTFAPDATKLWRSTEDALTGIAWVDDSQIVDQRIYKCYGQIPGVEIYVTELP